MKRLIYLFIILFHSWLYCYAESGQRISVLDFGAIPDDGLDDSENIRKACEYCRDNKSTVLFFPPGLYNFRDSLALQIEREAISGVYGENVQGRLFKPDAPYVKALDLFGAENLVVEAEGAILLLEGWYEVVSIDKAREVTIKGLSIVYRRPPNTVGKITKLNEGSFDMQIDPERYFYLYKDVTGRVHYVDAMRERLYTGGRVSGKELLSKDMIRIYTDFRPSTGDFCVLRHSGHYRPAIMIKESSDIYIEGVKIHSQPGMGVVGHLSENITLENLQVIPEAGMIISTNTDATHFTSCKGEIVIENCKFGGQGDDCTNIHNYYYTIVPQTKRSVEIKIQNADLHALSLDYPDVGDTLLVVNRSNLMEKEHFIVEQVDTSTVDWRVSVTLNKDWLIGSPDLYYMTNITRRPSVRITNNTVKSHLARAFLIKSRNVLINKNVVQNSTGTAIQLGAEAGWRESGPVENVLIENNWISGCGYAQGTQGASSGISISVSGIREKTGFLNNNILIRNNIIEAVNEHAISVEDAKSVRIINNDISGCPHPVYMKNTESVTVKDVRYSD
ncbi:right-handed parallel beta-helix repeat-containing protein [Parabacteroides goldsteinii]|uniref:right-handed parallel beta-helix repeat-containing protein n=1 Tax=Parabacteroides goldsteinii TaxID=328812 RepID=UPI002420258B|nr:right-handed parallel beta-helix repeat-containing protein [Parabacteroides goldsteinii]